MSLKSIQILGVNVTVNAREEILEYVGKYLEDTSNFKLQTVKLKTKPLIIVTPNPEQVVLAKRDKQFAKILNQADVALPDGIGIALAMKILNKLSAVSCQLSARERIPGIDFMGDLVGLAAKEGIGIGLIGGRDGVAVKALECLKRKHPKLQGWAEDGPEMALESNGKKMNYELRIVNYGNERRSAFSDAMIHDSFPMLQHTSVIEGYVRELVNRIRESGARLVFVGLGAPKQEFFIEAVSCQLSAVSCVLMSVGGSFDILAGRVPRAPFIMRYIGFEWLWRLTREPWRWRRQMALLKFFWLTIRTYVA